MAFITEPTVRLVSRTEVNWEAVSAFLDQEGVPPVPESIRAGDDESAAVVEISARVCYMSYGKGRRDIEEFITNLLSKGDGSVFEHVNYGFMMTGVSRAFTHELVRHRAGFAYSLRSQRFVYESDSDFVIPPALGEDRPGTVKARDIL
ncbi:MAG: FAD-dependent thymidylate synthase [Chloroflexota bacterium]|nr:FAD-dependent thymidylate synthase [Chloroflexota bacterium]